MELYSKLKKNIKYSTVFLVIGFLSCTNYLEVEPYGTPLDTSFYKTPADAQQALTAAYSALHVMYNDFTSTMGTDFIFGDVGTDDFIKGGISLANYPHLLEKQNYNIMTNNIDIEAIWITSYEGVLYANLVLDKVPSITFANTDDQKQILAEARFLRAFYYFDLVNSFGGVPLVDKPLAFGDYSVPRSTAQEIYTFIENDLKIAIADLPSRFTKGADYLGHADKGAALGLMMRVSLYQNKMDQVKTYGEQLFSIPQFSTLSVPYQTIFMKGGEWSNESLFEINCSTDISGLGTGLPTRISPITKKGGSFMQIQDGLRNEFEVNDPRYTSSFYYVPVSYGTSWFNKKYSWAPFSDYTFPTIGGNNNCANNIRILRLSDAYLMYAEAIYNTDPTTSIDYVNKVRSRARGTNATTVVPPIANLNGQALLNAIWHERRVELAGEGLRFHDLVRTGRAESILGSLGFTKGKHEVMPIPYSQVVLSKGILTQNNY